MKKNIIQIVIGCILFSLAGCIEEYTPTGINEIKDLLVVDGIITNDTSVISLRRSIGLQDYYRTEDLIKNAVLYVETEDGVKMAGTYQGNGSYAIPTGTLDPNKRYRLQILLDNEEYESDFLTPLFTPEIEVSILKEGPGKPVSIDVSTTEGDDNSRHYLWSYKEIWEYHSELYADGAIWWDKNIRQVIYFDLESSNNRYYCWGRDSSKTLILESTEKLSANVIKNKKLVVIPSSHEKLSTLYYLEVKQNQIRKDAYEYYSNLNKNREQTSSIFSPMPAEMKGNIRCVSNPNLPTLGYVDVSTTVNETLYIPYNREFYEPEIADCQETYDPIVGEGLVQYKVRGMAVYAREFCVDCRTLGGTKNKPDFWPTDHL